MALTTDDIKEIKNALQPSFDSLESSLTAKIEEQGQRVIDDVSEQLQTSLTLVEAVMNERFDAVDRRFDEVDRRFDRLRTVSEA